MATAGDRENEKSAAAGGKPPRRSIPRPLATSAARLTRRLFGRRGFARAEILTRWPEIVGPALAAQTMPERLSFPPGEGTDGTLTVRVGGALGVELQHLEPLVVERINARYGFKAVARLKLIQGPLPPRPAPPDRRPRPLTSEEQRRLVDALDRVEDPQIREALAALGRGVLAQRKNA